jgi:hypothetical protein
MGRSANGVRTGQYYAAAYNGNNGDLIIGKVTSVRANGLVILKNLLSNRPSTKKIEVLLRRNKRVSKASAHRILEDFVASSGDKFVARVTAVMTPSVGPQYKDQKTKKAKRSLSKADRKKIKVLTDVLAENLISLIEEIQNG